MVAVRSNHLNVAEGLSILRSSSFGFNAGQNPITVAMTVFTIITIWRFFFKIRLLKLKWLLPLLFAFAQMGGSGFQK